MWPGVFQSTPLPLDGMLVHPRVPPAMNLPVPICTNEWGESLRECLAQEHNTITTLARTQIWIARSGV